MDLVIRRKKKFVIYEVCVGDNLFFYNIGMVVANSSVTRPLSSRGLKNSSRPSSSQASTSKSLPCTCSNAVILADFTVCFIAHNQLILTHYIVNAV